MLSGSDSIAQFKPQNVAIWFSMAFQGGAINAGGFLACHRFVTHTTGFMTLFGTEMAKGNLAEALSFLTVPVFFLVGAMTSAYFVDRKLSIRKIPRYEWMFGTIAVAMTYVALSGNLNRFGVFGDPSSIFNDYVLIAILCFCSGIQNGTITSASDAVIRTTHMTGITTDLGLGLVRANSASHPEQAHEAKLNWVRFGLICFFGLGSAFSALLFHRYEYWGFLTPAFISLVLTVLTIWKRQVNKSMKGHNARAS